MSFIDRISRYDDLDDEERDCLVALESGTAEIFGAGEAMIPQGECGQDVWLIRKGWATSQECLSDGSCQVLCFLLPGDVVGLSHAFLGSGNGRSAGLANRAGSAVQVSALTEVHAVPLDTEYLRELSRTYPQLTSRILASVTIDTCVTLSRHLTNIGRRSARERLANLFIEFWERHQGGGVSPRLTFALPVNQTILADALGLTPVHVSRVLTQLSRDGVLSIQKRPRAVTIHDIERLFKIAGVMNGEENPPLAAHATPDARDYSILW